ncbi:dsDNA nuclease domain-containing protein [Streptomyces sp. NPDC059861]|uniref:dsDNA nuclease domain-containing protein n=1 Tax=Streptomyces sp. NPDC059861 TaxID=3346974 RepID=UPI00365604DD
MQGEDTGIQTFSRYRWQAKQAVRHWLTCIGSEEGAVEVVCERLEDIAIVYPNLVRFAQLKTRDRGSWSAKSTCDKGHGIDSLIRTYKAACQINVQNVSFFELWLEGPMSGTRETADFFGDPKSASAEIRKKIVALGLPKNDLDHFLSRLSVKVQQPSRAHMDAVVLREMSVIWPTCSMSELEEVYVRLLEAAAAAQAGESPMGAVHRYVAQALNNREQASGETQAPPDFSVHVLTVDTLRALTPPSPSESDKKLLERMAAGSITSMLELKLRRAGATEDTLRQAKEMRAEAEIDRQLVLASRSNSEHQFEKLGKRVLTVANAMAKKANLSGASNPVAATRPAEFVTAEMLSDPSILGQLDRDDLFDSDGLRVYGFLCHLSDQCLFAWRVI